jgi:hypothetical protein
MALKLPTHRGPAARRRPADFLLLSPLIPDDDLTGQTTPAARGGTAPLARATGLLGQLERVVVTGEQVGHLTRVVTEKQLYDP